LSRDIRRKHELDFLAPHLAVAHTQAACATFHTTLSNEMLMAMLSHPSERRVHQRVRQKASSVLFTVGPADVVIGQLYDLSLMGIGILSRRELAPHELIEIYIPAVDGHARGCASAEVRHSTIHPEGLWLLGCALFRPLTSTEISAFAQ